jgi:hypothetical protein
MSSDESCGEHSLGISLANRAPSQHLRIGFSNRNLASKLVEGDMQLIHKAWSRPIFPEELVTDSVERGDQACAKIQRPCINGPTSVR